MGRLRNIKVPESTPEEDTTLTLLPKQMEAYAALTDMDNSVSEVLYGGGARGGKTVLGCLWQIMMRFQYPGSVGMIGRDDFTQLMKTTFVTFKEVMGRLPEYYRSQMRFVAGVKNTMEFANGSKIYFVYFKKKPTDPNFDRFGSFAITDLFIDECQEVSEKVINVLKGRFSVLTGRYPDGTKWRVKPKALYTCNPSRGWIYTLFYKPDKMGRLPRYRRFIRSLPSDNPYITQDYIDNLMRSDAITVRRLVYGEFEYDDDPTLLIEPDAIEDLFYNEHIVPVGRKTLSADIATKGHDRFIAFSWAGCVASVAADEDYSPGKQVEKTIRGIMLSARVRPSDCIVDADGVGNFLSSYIPGVREFHGGARPADPRYANLRSECYFKLADLINRRMIRIICTRDQRERIKEELSVVRQIDIDNDTRRKTIIGKPEMKKMLGRSPDYSDALAMGMWFHRVPVSTGIRAKVHKHCRN